MKKLLTTLFIIHSLVSQGQTDLKPPLRYLGIPNVNYRFDEGLQIDDTLNPKGGIWIPSITALGGAGDSVLVKDATTSIVKLRPQAVSGAAGWELTGNSGTSAGTNFLGTTDSADLSFKTNAVEYMRLKAGGYFKLFQGYDSTRYNPLASDNYTIFTNNILIGDSAGWNIPTFTTAVHDSMTGHNNIFIGRWAGKNAIKPFANIFIGNACGMNTIGEWDFALNAPFWTGFENCIVGNYAFEKNIYGFENAAFGTGAMRDNISGIKNTAVGLSALMLNTTGIENVACGANAALLNETGEHNSAFGFCALRNSNSLNNSAVGAFAIGSFDVGQGNTGMGAFSLNNCASGITFNTALGIAAGNQSGRNACLYLGAYSGFFNTTIDNAIFIQNSDPFATPTFTITDDTTKGFFFGVGTFNPATSRGRFNATLGMYNTLQGVGKMTYCVDTNGYWAYTNPTINTTAGDGATINNITGRFRKDTSGSTFTLTSSFITANSIIQLTFASAPGATGYDAPIVVAGAGSAVITFGTASAPASPGNDVDVNFLILN